MPHNFDNIYKNIDCPKCASNARDFKYNILKYLKEKKVNVCYYLFLGNLIKFTKKEQSKWIALYVRTYIENKEPIFQLTRGSDFYLIANGNIFYLFKKEALPWKKRKRTLNFKLTTKLHKKHNLAINIKLLQEKEIKMEKEIIVENTESSKIQYSTQKHARDAAFIYAQELIDLNIPINMFRKDFAYYVIVNHYEKYSRKFPYEFKLMGEAITHLEQIQAKDK